MPLAMIFAVQQRLLRMLQTVVHLLGGKITANQISPAVVPNLINGTQYFFVVIPKNGSGDGASSTVASATPDSSTLGLATQEIDCSDTLDAGETLTLTDRNSGVDYLVTCNFPIIGSLIIDPDVTIEFRAEAGFNVTTSGGSIQAIGTAEKPITFTGEDKIKGTWKGVFIDSADVKNELTYVNIDYAGGSAFNSNGDRGAVIVWGGAFLKLQNNNISNSATFGVNAVYSGSQLTMTDNVIADCDSPMILSGPYISQIAGGTFTGNQLDAIIVESAGRPINSDDTWADHGVPYHIPTLLSVISGGGKLTINPGVTIKFGLDSGLFINEGASGSKPSLVAVGTPASPITFTGIDEVSGAWRSIRFDTPSPLNEIAFATIKYASNSSFEGKGAIYTWYGTILNVHDVAFENIQNDAMHVKKFPTGSLTVTNSNNTFSNIGGLDFNVNND